MEFAGEVHYSGKGKFPVVFYRSRSDPTKCFKYIHRRTDRYKCYQCSKIGEKDLNASVYSIGFKDGKFESDPELMEHKCVVAGKLLDYTDVVAQQCYRDGLRLAKKEQFQPSVVDHFVRYRIEKRLGAEAAETMKGLVAQKNRYSSYSRKLKRKRLEGEDGQRVEDEESNDGSDAELEVDIEPEMLAELRRLNDGIEVKLKHKRVRPIYIPSNSTPVGQATLAEAGPSNETNIIDEYFNLNETMVNETMVNQTISNESIGNESIGNESIGNEAAANIEGESEFIGEFGYSKSNKQPIIIYRLKNDPSKCFTFHMRRTNSNDASYTCSQCVLVRNEEKEQEIVLDCIRVEGDRFQSDPEAMYHYCTQAGYVLNYIEVITRQIQRAALILAEEESLDGTVVDQLLLMEIHEYFGKNASQAMAYLPHRKSRIKSYGTRRKVGNNIPKKEPRITESGFLYEATVGYTKDGTNPLLIVRRSDDPTKAYTFVSKRKNWYQCSMCCEAYKLDPIRNKNSTIKVTDNYFHTDPEEHPHSCVSAGFELPYAKVVATQCYREGMRIAQSCEVDQVEVDRLVLEQIKTNFPDEDEAKEAMTYLPDKASRYKGYRNRISGKTGKQQIVIMNNGEEENTEMD